MEDYIKPTEFAKKLNVCQQTLNQWIREGFVKALVIQRPHKKVYRIPLSEVERFEKEYLNVNKD